MLSPDVELVGLDGRHLAGWMELLLPPAATRDPQSFAVVFIDGDRRRVLKAVCGGRGAAPPGEVPFTGIGRSELAALRRRLGVGALLVLDPDALPRLFAAAESRLRLTDDYAAQAVTIWRALKETAGRGLWMEPRVLELLPVVPYEALQQTFDLLVPDRSSMVAYVIEDDRRSVAASVIAVKRGGDVVLATTHLGVKDAVAERDLARSWRSQYTRVLDAVEDRFAPPSVGLFLERATLRRILAGRPDQLSKELQAGRVVIDPMPGWLAGILGGAAAMAMAARSAKVLSRFVPAGAKKAAAGIASVAGEQLRARGADPRAVLGFDPVEMWQGLRGFYEERGGSNQR